MYSYEKPKVPDCTGPQFMDSPTGGIVSPDNYLSVSRDRFNNEIPADRPMHDNATPQVSGGINYQGNQYSTDFSSYGVSVDAGDNMSASVMVDNSKADRGKDA